MNNMPCDSMAVTCPLYGELWENTDLCSGLQSSRLNQGQFDQLLYKPLMAKKENKKPEVKKTLSVSDITQREEQCQYRSHCAGKSIAPVVSVLCSQMG